MDSWTQPRRQPFFGLAKSIKGLGLLKNVQDHLGRIAGVKLCGKRMCEKILFREPLLVLVKGRIEYQSEVASGGKNIGLNDCGHEGCNRCGVDSYIVPVGEAQSARVGENGGLTASCRTAWIMHEKACFYFQILICAVTARLETAHKPSRTIIKWLVSWLGSSSASTKKGYND